MVRCPVNTNGLDCPTDVQRLPDPKSTEADGLREHMRFVHPELHQHTVSMLIEQATS